MKINVLGVAFNSDGTPPEKENPAQGIRDAGLTHLLASKGHVVTDFGDLKIPEAEGYRDEKTGILNLGALQDTSRQLAAKLTEILNPAEFSILLGGDCAILIGIFGAFARSNTRVGLVFFDGHADFHSLETSPTGEAADFELAFLTGRGPKEISQLFEKNPLIMDEDILIYGLREPDLISESSIRVFDKEQMINNGIDSCVKQGFRRLIKINLPLWLHFDVDVVDPSLVPVLIPASNGLTFEQTQAFLSLALTSKQFIGMSVSCYHPNLDTTGDAGSRLSTIISHAIQSRASM